MRINSNLPSINAQRNVYNQEQQIAKSIEKLSSGLKVNRGADGPADLIISEMLRGKIASYKQAQANNEISINVVQTAEAAIEEANQLMIRMRQLAIHASNEGANDKNMLEADQLEIESAKEQLNRIAKNTKFGDKNLLDGTNAVLGMSNTKELEVISGGKDMPVRADQTYAVSITQTAQYAGITGNETLDQDLIDEGEVLKVFQNGKTVEYTTTSKDNAGLVVNKLNAMFEENNMDVRATLTEDEELSLKSTIIGSESEFSAYSTTQGVLSIEENEISRIRNGRDVAGSINGVQVEGKGDKLIGTPGSGSDGLVIWFKNLQNQDFQIDDNDNYNAGVIELKQNSLRFQIGGDYGETINVKMPTTYTTFIGKNVENQSGYDNLSQIDLRSFQGAQDALLVIDKAMTDLSLSRAELGAMQRHNLESNLRYMMSVTENAIGAESIIRDTNYAKEISNLTKRDIISKAGMAALSHANRNPENVLTLLN